MSNHTAYVNRLTSLLDQAFPGYSKIFNRVASKSSLAVLKAFPTPGMLLGAEPDQLAELIAAASRRGAGTDYVMTKVSDLFKTASYATQFNIKRDAYRILICTVADILENLQLHIKTLEKQIVVLAKESPEIYYEIQLLDSIPGIGLFSAAALRSEIGDFTLFKKPKQLVAFFGLDPSTRQSGKFVGTKTKLSKRGSPYARGLLDICAQTAVHPMKGNAPANPVLAAYYAEKIKTKAPKVVKCTIMRKMVELIFAVLRDKKPFVLRTPQEHVQMLQARNSALVAA